MTQARFYSSIALPATLVGALGASGNPVVGTITGLPASRPYTLVIDPGVVNGGTLKQEVILVTAAPTDNGDGTWTLTCTRGYDGTTAQSHLAGATIEHGVSQQDFNDIQAHIAATTNVHGITDTADFMVRGNNLSELTNTTTARSNLGLGTVAVKNNADVALTANNLTDLTSASAARSALGLGTSATADIDTVSGDISTSAVGDTVAVGSVGKAADSGHRHAREAFGLAAAIKSGTTASGAGTATTIARADHTHPTRNYDVVADYGADPTGSVDATTAFQNCIDAITGAATPSSNIRLAKGKMIIPPGTYKISADLNFISVQGFLFQGAGQELTFLSVTGTSFTNTVLNIDGAFGCTFDGFTIKGDTTEQVTSALRLTKTAAAQRSTSSNTLSNIGVRNLKHVTGFDLSGSGANQLDGTTLRHCVINGAQTAGSWSSSGNWQNGILFGNGTFGNNYDQVAYNVNVAQFYYGYNVNASSFSLFGAQPGLNAIDFYINPSAQMTIEDIQSQSSGQFVVQPSGFSPEAVSFRNCEFVSANMTAGGKWISLHGGPWTFDNMVCVNSGTAAIVEILGSASIRPGVVTFTNLTQNNTLSAGFSLTANQVKVVVINYANYNTSTAAYTTVPFAIHEGTYWNTTSNVFNPAVFGAVGDGAADDTTALASCITAAVAAKGVIDLNSKTYKTTTALTTASYLHIQNGTITNSASDVFTVATSSLVTIKNLTITASGGHIFNGTGTPGGSPGLSGWQISGCNFTQNNTGKSIWHQVGGGFISSHVHDCILTQAASSTVPAWDVYEAVGAYNGSEFSNLLCQSNSTSAVPFFKIDMGASNGYSIGLQFKSIIFELSLGGAIWMSGCAQVVIEDCQVWDGSPYTSDLLSFNQSTNGYPCRNVTIRRSGMAGGTLGSGVHDIFCDSNTTSVIIESCGTWGTAPVISSPAAQTSVSGGFGDMPRYYGASSNMVATGYVAATADRFTTSDSGLTAAAYPSGSITLTRLVIPSPVLCVGNIEYLWAAGTGTTGSNGYVAIFDSTGAQIAVSADISGQSASGNKILTTGKTYWPAGYYYFAYVIGTQWGTNYAGPRCTGTFNVLMSTHPTGDTSPYAMSQKTGSLTAMPGSLTLGSGWTDWYTHMYCALR